MARRKDKPADALGPVSDYRHSKAKRKNNPPAKIAAEGTVPVLPKIEYAYSPRRPPTLRFDPTGGADQLPELLAESTRRKLTAEEARTLAEALRTHEPWLEWAGKRESEAAGFVVDPVALHIHERIAAQAILKVAAREDVARSLFADPEEAYQEAVQFYRHDIDWTNRLILGDSLQVMASLARREDLAGCIPKKWWLSRAFPLISWSWHEVMQEIRGAAATLVMEAHPDAGGCPCVVEDLAR